MRTRVVAAAAAMVTAAGVLSVLPQPASAGQGQAHLVSDNPADFTPHVLDGEVFAVAQAGNKIILGGTFTQARNNGSSTVLTRNRIMAFNATTGVIDTAFVPNANSTVRTIVPAADGQSVYVGGQFSSIGGGTAYKLARLDINTGKKVSGFNPGVINALVYDAELVNGRLFVAGQFTSIKDQSRLRLAELSPSTGAVRAGVNVAFGGTHRGLGSSLIRKIAVASTADRLVAVGNFGTAGGLDRNQVAVIDISGPTATVADWHTDRFVPPCATFQYYLNDVDLSPDGSYFVVGTTGAYAAPPKLCDTASRWETNATGSQQPSWVDYTGGDTTYSVEATGSAVYVGGHQRWWNSPTRINGLGGPGSVSRTGIGALDPVNGLPLSWNPTRTRGRGVFDFLATGNGLWVGSDTDRIGQAFEFHARIAFFPFAGGKSVPQPAPPAFPVDVHLLGVTGDQSFRRPYNGTTVGADTALAGGIPWGDARGAFWTAGQLYTAWNDGTLTRRAYTGGGFGTPTTLNLNGLTDFAADMQAMTGLFYDKGRIYFTKTNDTNLYMRYFTVEDGLVGAERFAIVGNLAGLDWRDVQGMFLVGDRLYWADRSTGDLHRINWQRNAANGVPVGGTDVVVDSAHNWTADALFAGPSSG